MFKSYVFVLISIHASAFEDIFQKIAEGHSELVSQICCEIPEYTGMLGLMFVSFKILFLLFVGSLFLRVLPMKGKYDTNVYIYIF